MVEIYALFLAIEKDNKKEVLKIINSEKDKNKRYILKNFAFGYLYGRKI